MKKAIAVILAVLNVIFLLCGCGTENSSDYKPNKPANPMKTETVSNGESAQAELNLKFPVIIGNKLEAIQKAAQDNNFALTVEYEYSDLEAGTVINAEYEGKECDGYCEVNPYYPLTVKVSKGKKPETQEQTEIETNPDPKPSDGGIIYLTFDDGPCANTKTVLDILAKYNAKATFFMVGMYAAARPDDVKAVYEAGHLIGCHSYTHDYNSLYESAYTATNEVERWEKTIMAATGELPEGKCFRFPGGSNMSTLSVAKFNEIHSALSARGYRSFDWTIADNDRYLAGKPAGMSNVEYMKKSTQDTMNWRKNSSMPKIMLMHDTSTDTVEALDWILNYFVSLGYSFDTLDHLEEEWTFR